MVEVHTADPETDRGGRLYRREQPIWTVSDSSAITQPGCDSAALTTCSFVVTKLLGYPHLARATCEAILNSHPPVAVTHHGVNFVKMALNDTGRPGMSKYIDAICNHEDG